MPELVAQNHGCFRPPGSVKASASPLRWRRSEIPCARPGQSMPGLGGGGGGSRVGRGFVAHAACSLRRGRLERSASSSFHGCGTGGGETAFTAHGLFTVNDLSAELGLCVRGTCRAFSRGNELTDRSGPSGARRCDTCWYPPRGDYPPSSDLSSLSRGACGCTEHAGRRADESERRSVAEQSRDGDVRVEDWRDHALRGRHVERRCSCPFVRDGGVPAREDLGLRR